MDFSKLTFFCLVAINIIEVESKTINFSIKHVQQNTYLGGEYSYLNSNQLLFISTTLQK